MCCSAGQFIFVLSDMKVFFLSRQPAPYMALGFIYIQYFTHLSGKERINILNSAGNIFMYGCGYLERFWLKLFSFLL